MIDHRCDPTQRCRLCGRNVPLTPGVGQRSAAAAPVRTPLPVCPHLGAEVVRVAGSTRFWRRCGAGHGSTASGAEGLVCSCGTPGAGVWRQGKECGPTCPGYPTTSLPRWHPVPVPAVVPTRPRLVLTIVIGDDAEQVHAATGSSQRAYAERLGANYVVITGQTQDERMVCAEKWRVKDYVPHYPGGTVYLDADVWVSPATPDLFAATPPAAVGMVDIAPRMPAIVGWARGKADEICRTQGMTTPPFEPKYWNSGVWVGRPEHAAYWEPPPHPYPASWCTEELWCRLTATRLGMPIHDLDGRFNWTWNTDRQLADAAENPPWVWHFAGMGSAEAEAIAEWKQSNRVWRLAMLRLLAAKSDSGR